MGALDDNSIRLALARLGETLNSAHRVEILVVGGAAGVLTGELPSAWTTADVDFIHCHLPQDRDAVLTAAGSVAQELSLPADWLNDWGGLYAWTLSDTWRDRRVEVGVYGSLTVFAAGRRDLIAMKFIAHRPHDLEHLEQLSVTTNDLTFARDHLRVLARRYPPERFPAEAGRIEMAVQYADSWEVPK